MQKGHLNHSVCHGLSAEKEDQVKQHMGLKTFQNVLNLRLCVAQISLPFPLQENQVYFASCGFAVHITLWEDHVYRKSNFV